MSYSKLTDKYLPVPFHGGKREGGTIRHIVLHHNAGINTIESLYEFFISGVRKVSATYGIGYDGKMACYVDEENRPYTTNGYYPDNDSITFEISNNAKGDPYSGKGWTMSDATIRMVILACADVIQRHQIPGEIYTGDTNGIITTHRMYEATACPGDYLESKLPYIAEEIKKILKSGRSVEEMFKVQVGAFKKRENAEKLLKELKSKGYEAFIVETPDTPVQVPKPKKSVSQVADEVLQGLWGNGQERADKLSKAGYNYDEVQREVNKKIYGK